MDFYKLLKDRSRHNIALNFVDRFRKCSFTIPCKKTIDAKETAQLYIYYVYRIYKPLDTIVSN
jgi:hypothetical protein